MLLERRVRHAMLSSDRSDREPGVQNVFQGVFDLIFTELEITGTSTNPHVMSRHDRLHPCNLSFEAKLSPETYSIIVGISHFMEM